MQSRKERFFYPILDVVPINIKPVVFCNNLLVISQIRLPRNMSDHLIESNKMSTGLKKILRNLSIRKKTIFWCNKRLDLCMKSAK